MRKFGCLLIGLICFVSIVGVYAFNIIEKDDVHTPDYYESNVRSMFGREQWEAGKQLLDEGLSIYPDVNGLNELCGRYHYRKKDYDTARYGRCGTTRRMWKPNSCLLRWRMKPETIPVPFVMSMSFWRLTLTGKDFGGRR